MNDRKISEARIKSQTSGDARKRSRRELETLLLILGSKGLESDNPLRAKTTIEDSLRVLSMHLEGAMNIIELYEAQNTGNIPLATYQYNKEQAVALREICNLLNSKPDHQSCSGQSSKSQIYKRNGK